MSKHPGLYLARCIGSDDTVRVFIPQLFGDVQVPITEWIGTKPVSQTFGFVSFIGGDASYPVWMGERKQL